MRWQVESGNERMKTSFIHGVENLSWYKHDDNKKELRKIVWFIFKDSHPLLHLFIIVDGEILNHLLAELWNFYLENHNLLKFTVFCYCKNIGNNEQLFFYHQICDFHDLNAIFHNYRDFSCSLRIWESDLFL